MTITIGSLTFTITPKYRHAYRKRKVEAVETVHVANDGTTYHYCSGTANRYVIPLSFTESQRQTLEGYRDSVATLQIDSETATSVKLIGNYEYRERWIQGQAMYEEELEFLEV